MQTPINSKQRSNAHVFMLTKTVKPTKKPRMSRHSLGNKRQSSTQYKLIAYSNTETKPKTKQNDETELSHNI